GGRESEASVGASAQPASPPVSSRDAQGRRSTTSAGPALPTSLTRVAMRTAMLVSGHKTLSMLARYNIRRREAVRHAMQRVEEYVQTMPTFGTVELFKPPRGRL